MNKSFHVKTNYPQKKVSPWLRNKFQINHFLVLFTNYMSSLPAVNFGVLFNVLKNITFISWH